MPAKEVVDWLRRTGTRRNREGMARYGLPSTRAFGVPVGVLQARARAIGRDHALAEALWRTGWYEARELSKQPSEYFRTQCWLSVEADEETVVHYLDWFGDDNLVFSTDFPHGDSQYPHALESFRKLPLPEQSQRRIVGENWSRLYGIPLAAAARRG